MVQEPANRFFSHDSCPNDNTVSMWEMKSKIESRMRPINWMIGTRDLKDNILSRLKYIINATLSKTRKDKYQYPPRYIISRLRFFIKCINHLIFENINHLIFKMRDCYFIPDYHLNMTELGRQNG